MRLLIWLFILFLSSISLAGIDVDKHIEISLHKTYEKNSSVIFEYLIKWEPSCFRYQRIEKSSNRVFIDPGYDIVYEKGVGPECFTNYELWLTGTDKVIEKSVKTGIFDDKNVDVVIPIPRGYLCGIEEAPYQRMFQVSFEKLFDPDFIKNHPELYNDQTVTYSLKTKYLYEEADVFRELSVVMSKYGLKLKNYDIYKGLGYYDKVMPREDWPDKYKKNKNYTRDFVSIECSPMAHYGY